MNNSNYKYSVTLIGKQTVGPWRGQVHSIFDKAINLLVSDQRITLVSNRLWVSEYNIVFNDQQLFKSIKPASEIAIQDDCFYIDGDVMASCGNAEIWQMPPLLPLTIIDSALQQIESFLAGQAGDKISQIIEQQFLTSIKQFMQTGSADFSHTVGAGYGLTPTGDDMLVGFALAIACYQPQRLADLARLCQPYLIYTTDISRYLLQDALQGQFSAPLINLLLALQYNQAISHAIAIAANIGSSSGRDGIWGLLQGLKLFNGVTATQAAQKN